MNKCRLGLAWGAVTIASLCVSAADTPPSGVTLVDLTTAATAGLSALIDTAESASGTLTIKSQGVVVFVR